MTSAQTDSELAMISCDEEGQIHSQFHSPGNGPLIGLRLVNESADVLSVFWLDGKDERHFWTTLSPEETVDANNVRATLPWLFTTSGGRCIGVYITPEAPATITIPANFKASGGVPQFPDTTPGKNNTVFPFFEKPFEGDFVLTNVFDHNLPFQFKDNNGFLLNWKGEKTRGIDGHTGYDWPMPEGTPLLAVADGEVFNVQVERFNCPVLGNRSVRQQNLIIRHTAPNGETYFVLYAHVSRFNVSSFRQEVKGGQVIAFSGNTGCSTDPHLHFEVRKARNRFDQTGILVDPYGWEGDGQDPWAQDSRGTKSVWLWKPGQAPKIISVYNKIDVR